MWGNNSGTRHKRGPLDLAAILRSTTALTGLALAVALMAGPAQAQDIWTGAISSDWFDPGNWADGSVPTAADVVYVQPVIPGTTSIAGTANAAALYVSNEDHNGYVSIAGGGVLNTDVGVLGPSGSAVVTVGGAGSTWNSTELTIGGAGSGRLFISPGGQVNSGDTIMGDSATGSGTATLENPGTLWMISGDFSIGYRGIGRLEIINGSAVVSGRSVLGGEAGSFGEVTVTGGGSIWNNTEVIIGFEGDAALTIEDGGTANSTAVAVAGSGSTGIVTVRGGGSNWNVTNELGIGVLGAGRLIIENGGAVTSADSTLGEAEGSLGEVTVTGTGSTWTNAGSLYLGSSGAGSLTIENGGTVTSGDAYFADQVGATGNLTVSGLGTWNAGGLYIGEDGMGRLTIEGGGDVNSRSGDIGVYDGIGFATVSGAGSTWINTSYMMVGEYGAGTLIIEDGGSVSNTDGYIGYEGGSAGAVSLTGASTWTNAGDVFVGSLGSGTLTIGLGATASAAGTVTVADQPGSSGLLVVNGDLVGTGGVGVNTGGRLMGSGTVRGNTNVSGTVAPGNSIGTLHFIDPYTQAAGSTYEVEVDATGNADLIAVTDIVTLNGGTVEVIPLPDLATDTPYVIVMALGGVTGTFDEVTMGRSSAFLAPQLIYGANEVTLIISQTASLASAPLTPNQRAAAVGADSLGSGHPMWDGIVLLSSAAAPAAFDAISGEVHASAKSVLIEDSRFLREAMDDRLRAAFAGVAANVTPVLGYAAGGPVAVPADTGRSAIWGHAFGAWSEWDSDGNAAALVRDTGGILFGGDAMVGDNWRLGLIAGYSHSGFEIGDRASSGSADSYHLGAYAGTEIGQWGLRLGGAYSWHGIETARTAAFPGFTDHLSAQYGAGTAQIFGEAGYRIDTEIASFEPFANLAYVNVHTEGFTESGGAAALTASGSSKDTLFATLGVRAETTLAVGDIEARVHGTLGWRHAFGDVTPTTDLAFAGSGAFSIAGVPIAQDAAVIEAGLDLTLSPGANLGIAYNGQIGSGVQDHQLKAQLAVSF